MKLISFNVGIRIDNTDAVVEYLKQQQADIICLQEVVRGFPPVADPVYRSEEIIRTALQNDFPYYFFAAEWTADKLVSAIEHKNRNFGGMVEQGKMILSKYPILHGYNYFYHKVYEFDSDRTNFDTGNDHGRSLQIAELEINGKIIQLANVHGIYSSKKDDSERSLAQSRFIVETLQKKDLPTIIAGDFNVAPETESIAVVNKAFRNLNQEFSTGATRPNGQVIDYFFASQEIPVKSLSVEVTDISDHYPVICEINI